MRWLVSSANGLDAFDGVFPEHLGQHLVASIAVAASRAYDVCHGVLLIWNMCQAGGVTQAA